MIEKSVRLVNLIKMIGKLTNNMDFIRTNLGLKSNTEQGGDRGGQTICGQKSLDTGLLSKTALSFESDCTCKHPPPPQLLKK